MKEKRAEREKKTVSTVPTVVMLTQVKFFESKQEECTKFKVHLFFTTVGISSTLSDLIRLFNSIYVVCRLRAQSTRSWSTVMIGHIEGDSLARTC
jgi:hypothetical protein